MPATLTEARFTLTRSELAAAVPGATALGHDAFGASLDAIDGALPLLHAIRSGLPVKATGLENLPATGPVVLLANHPSPLPIASLALAAACLLDAPSPRLPRPELEPWAAPLPWVGLFLRRLGHVNADPRNAAALLERGELLVHSPPASLAGRAGPLGPWRREVLRLAVRARALVAPVAITGAERVVPTARLGLLARLVGLRNPPFVLAGLPRRSLVHVAVGTPRRLEHVPLEGAELDAYALELEREVARLAERPV